MEIVKESLDKWLESLKPYQRDAIKIMLQNNDGDEEKIAQLWLNSKGPINTVTFGGNPSNIPNKNYFQCLKRELNKFICGDESYETDRKQILGENNCINIAFTTSIASILAPIVGMSAAILTPAIVLLLYVIGKISVNAYCAMVK